MKVIGAIINYMERELIHGQMDVNMTVFMRMTRNQGLASIDGPTEEYMKDTGMKENNMARENSPIKKVKLRVGYGIKELLYNGWMKKI
jgi:hypothetical protein